MFGCEWKGMRGVLNVDGVVVLYDECEGRGYVVCRRGVRMRLCVFGI